MRKSEVYRIHLTFTEPVLGTSPKNRDLFETYVASNRPETMDE